MIDEKKLIADMEKLPFIHGRYDKKNANPHFISGVESMYEMIKELIKSQPKVGEWIPCSERLPEKDGVYIVDDRAFNSPWVHTAGFKVSSKAWCENHGVYYDDKYGRYEDGRVIAWQPLPEPWKEKTHDR